VVVVAAIVEREDRLLVTERLPGTHLAGYWEFPGGKTEDGENHQRCLEREMREELGVGVEVGNRIHATSFAYPDRTVDLHFYRCTIIGDPKPVLGQCVRWVSRAELGTMRFPPADLELINLLRG
jgi:mutator protein MutT